MDEGRVIMSQRELNRFAVINEVIEGNLTVSKAAGQLNLSIRQIHRIKKKVVRDGVAALPHKNRGKSPANKIPDEVLNRIAILYETRYEGFNVVHFTEKLNEIEGLEISHETVRKNLLSSGLITRTKKHPKHRSRRERMAKEGMLVQMDTSEHNWLRSRGDELVLIAAIDDATSEVVGASFETMDGTISNMALMKTIVATKGIPLAFYVDAAGHFKVSEKESTRIKITGNYGPTQIARALDELGINLIIADSPQAKGRIERLFETLQDRLLNEMTLADITTQSEANAFLATFIPAFNDRFMVKPRSDESAYLAVPDYVDLDTIFCIKHKRTVKSDNTISYRGRIFQICPSSVRISFAKAKVDVHECIDGRVRVFYNSTMLAIIELEPVLQQRKSKMLTFEDFARSVKKEERALVT